MKRNLRMMRSILKSCLFLSMALAQNAFAEQSLNRTVAIVNDDVITQHELNRSLEFGRKEQNIPAYEANSLPFQRAILAELIIDKIVNQIAQMNHITLSDTELNGAIAEMAANSRIPLEHFKEAIEAQGLSFDLYQEKIREKLLINKLEQQAISPQIQITPTEIEDQVVYMQNNYPFGTEFEVVHILIPIADPQRDAQAAQQEQDKQTEREQVNSIIEAHQQGTPFEELVKKYSKASDSATGGSLGMRTIDEIPEAFVEPLKKLKPGEVSPVIATETGYHIIQLKSIDSPFLRPYIVDEVHIQQIVINITPLVTDAQAHTTLLNIIQDLLNHKDSFENLAKRSSEDPISAPKGGDMGWSVTDKLPMEIRLAINNTPEGHISDPIRSENAWSIVKVLEHRSQDRQELHQRHLASQVLFEKKAQVALQAWKAQLRTESYVNILVPELRIDSLSR